MNARIRSLLALAALVPATPALAAKLKVPAQYPTIQGAVDAASPGDVILVSAGTYLEDVSFSGQQDIELRGKGKVVLDAGGAGNVIDTFDCSGIVLRGLILQNGVNGFLGSQSSDLLIEDCVVRDVTASAYLFNGSTGCRLVDSKARNANFGARTTDSMGCSIESSRFEDIATDGIALLGSLHTARENVVENAGEYGIRVGTDLDAADNCLLVDNEIVGAANDGILVNAGSNGATLIGNRIRNVLDDGIQLMQNSEGHVLDQNDVRQCASSGVVVYADFATVSRSRVKKAGFDGLIVQSLADECLFLDNRVRASGDDGFRVASGGHSFVGNKASKNVGFDLNDTAAPGSNAYVGNEFETTN